MHVETIEPLKKLIGEHKTKLKHAAISLHKADLKFCNAREDLEKLKTQYLNAYKTFDESVETYNSMIIRVRASSDKQRKLNKKLTQLFTNCKEAEKKYITFTYSAKGARIEYINEVGAALDIYQKLEEERMNLLKEKLGDYYKKLAILGEKMKAVTDNISSRSIPDISFSKEISRIVETFATEKHEIEAIEFAHAVSRYEDILKKFNTLYVKANSPVISSLEEFKIAGDDFNAEEADNITQVCKSILEDSWNAADISPIRISEFKEIVKTVKGRRQFCEALSEFRTKGIFIIPIKGYKLVAELLNIVLDEADNNYDINNALQILILSQTYYAKAIREMKHLEKIYLQQSIQDHPLWKKVSFWEQAIRMNVEAEKSVVASYIESEEEKTMRDQSMIFGRLGTFGYNMQQFGLDQETCEKVIFGYAEEAGLSEDMLPGLKVRLGENVANDCAGEEERR
eukprot:TRINITY_DN1838_c0_g1_i6.p1 TRINITY_DN1838_c0_g1~~TRINITY_DN1838_c0_g1_i6.p1  ORF type:complete len:456 (+),score=135.84 TRINITY_DN1838_c0_g1_i6:403-1770(+)